MADTTNSRHGVVFENASPNLAAYVKRVISHQMAEVLIDRALDLFNHRDVVEALQCGNFGPASIIECSPISVKIAHQHASICA